MKLEEDFKNKILSTFDEEGIIWLNNIDKIIDKYTKKLGLENIKIRKQLSINILLEAYSKQFGDVIIKILSPGIISLNEIKYVNELNLKKIVKCYYYNLDDRIMILEKINPGYCLSKLKNIDDRIKIFKDILTDICDNTADFIDQFPQLETKLYDSVQHNNKYEQVISNLLDIAKDMYKQIKKYNYPKYVLHNDLHHKNILKSKEGWKIIDPHGVVGEKIFDTAQFIKEELKLQENDVSTLDSIINKMSETINEEKKLIYMALFIQNTTKLLYYLKANYDEKTIDNNINLCNFILERLKIL